MPHSEYVFELEQYLTTLQIRAGSVANQATPVSQTDIDLANFANAFSAADLSREYVTFSLFHSSTFHPGYIIPLPHHG
jgi:hypothetical protein